jgi:endonuclease-3
MKRAASAQTAKKAPPLKKPAIAPSIPDVEDLVAPVAAAGLQTQQPFVPRHWQQVFAGITRQRERLPPAPVDTMGCATLADPSTPPAVQRFHILVSLLLSSQTKDQVTSAAVRALQTQVPGGLTPAALLALPAAKIDKLIEKVGFHTRKTQYLLGVARRCEEEHGGDIPRDLRGLLDLPGIGPKMAHLVMQAAWGQSDGIGVDVHVHRIAHRLGWVPTPAGKGAGRLWEKRDPEVTREALQGWLPRDLWAPINPLLVGFGQLLCLPRNPNCFDCDVKSLCPSAFLEVSKKNQKKAEEERRKLGL